ncbi:serine/threonine-protein phosphatase 1 regulatory subunit 10 isoform X2 [Trichomycterus rosablanca]
MAVGPVDPREVLKGVESLLGKDGELRSLEGVAKVFSLMKASHKMVSRCMYLNILLQTKSHDILNRFIRVGGYKLLNSWLTYSKTTNNTPMLQLILLTLQKLPLTVDHLKQNNTAKLVKHLSKSGETEELRKLALVLVDGWMAIIRSQSVSSGVSPNDKKRKKEEVKVRPEAKAAEKGTDEEKKKEKPKAHAPSHAKIRSTGLEIESPTPVPAKKALPIPQLGDKYNIKPAVLKRPSSAASDAPPVEKKYKPLNITPNTTKDIKVKLIPAQPMECPGFLDALNSAPVPGIKIKKKKPKVASPTSNKPCLFESKPQAYSSTHAKPASPEAPASQTPPHEPQDGEPPGTPVPAEDPEPMDTDKPNALAEPREEEESLTKKGKKKKSVRWAEEEQLKEYFYFDLDETERVNVNKIKDFGEAAKRELMMDRHTFEMSRQLSHDTMEERVPWASLRPLTLTGCLVISGSNSTEKLTQRDREMGILQEIFLSKESVPDCPHEPDPESYEPMPPRLIPLDEDSTTVDDSDMETETSSSGPASSAQEGSKLPPVLANLMGNLNSNRSPQNQGSTPPPANNPAVNVQELLSSIMGAQGANQSAEDLIKQPDFSDKIKQLLGSLQQNQNQNQNQNQQGNGPPMNPGMHGQGPGMNMQMPMNGGFPPNKPPVGPHFGHPPPPPPHGHGPPFGGGPRMMGPPPGPQGRGGDNGNYWGDDPMRGGPHRGGHFHRGRGRGAGGDQGFRGRGGRGGPRGGLNNMGDMSKRPVCRHFMMKGNCRYESNCAFYHPGVNGPPLPPQHGH